MPITVLAMQKVSRAFAHTRATLQTALRRPVATVSNSAAKSSLPKKWATASLNGVKKHPVAAVAAAYGLYAAVLYKASQDMECFVITDVGALVRQEMPFKLETALAQESTKPSNLAGTQSFNAVYALSGTTPSTTDLAQQHQDFRATCDDVWKKFYKSGGLLMAKVVPPPHHQRQRWTDLVHYFAQQEALHPDHYAVYHGTSCFTDMAFRTAQHQPHSQWLLLRDLGDTSELDTVCDPSTVLNMDPVRAGLRSTQRAIDRRPKQYPEEPLGKRELHDQDEAGKRLFLSVNYTPVSNSSALFGSYNGCNTLAFFQPHMPTAAAQKMASVMTPYLFAPLEQTTSHIERWLSKQSPKETSAAIIQILIPKKLVNDTRHWAYNSYPYGLKKKVTFTEAIDSLKVGSSQQEWNTSEARLALTRDLFENPESGITMNAVLLTSKQTMQNTVRDCAALEKR